MSVVDRQRSCAACGGELGSDVELEVLIDDVVRYIAVHAGHHTAPVADPDHERGTATPHDVLDHGAAA